MDCVALCLCVCCLFPIQTPRRKGVVAVACACIPPLPILYMMSDRTMEMEISGSVHVEEEVHP